MAPQFHVLIALFAFILAGCTSSGGDAATHPLNVPDPASLLPTITDLPTGYELVAQQASKTVWEGSYGGHQAVFTSNEGDAARSLVAVAWIYNTNEYARQAYETLTQPPTGNATALDIGEQGQHSRRTDRTEVTEQVVIQDGLVVWMITHTVQTAAGMDIDVVKLARDLVAQAEASNQSATPGAST